MGIVKQSKEIATVKELRDVLAEYPDDMSVGDVFGEALMVTQVNDDLGEYLQIN